MVMLQTYLKTTVHQEEEEEEEKEEEEESRDDQIQITSVGPRDYFRKQKEISQR